MRKKLQMDKEDKNFFSEFEYPTYDEWKKQAVSSLKGIDFDKITKHTTLEGISLKGIYNESDINEINFLSQQLSGEYPFNRGIFISGYKGKNWEILQNIPYFDANEFNQALKHDLTKGQNSIRINIEQANTIHEDFIAEDLTGTKLIITQPEDLSTALKDIDLSLYPIHINAGIGSYGAFCTLFSIIKDNQKYKEINGTLEYDFITELAKEGTLYSDLSRYYKELNSLTLWANDNLPKFRTISINAVDWHKAGANIVQESAISLSIAVNYIEELLNLGLDINSIAQKISFNFSISNNFFMEIAKFRALRIIWARLIKEYGGDDNSQKMYLKANCSEREITKLSPYNNILRATTQVLSAILGNCNSITVNNFDSAYGKPNEFSRRVARNIQNVAKYEAHLSDTIDSAAGSYYIEYLTNELINTVWEEFLSIENNGGIIEQIKNQIIQDKIQESFDKKQDNLAFRKDIIVGVNKYANINEQSLDTATLPDRDNIRNIVNEYDNYLSSRNTSEIDSILDNFENTFDSAPKQAVDLAIDALKKGASLSELYNSIPDKKSDFIKIQPIIFKRNSEVFEKFRDAMDKYIKSKNEIPTLSFLCFGELKDWKARADFSSDFFAVGGFNYQIYDNNFTIEEGISRLNTDNQNFIVICSNDNIYTEIVADFARKMKLLNKENYLILAGYPKEKIEEYKNAGIDLFIHTKANVIDCLNSLFDAYGIDR